LHTDLCRWPRLFPWSERLSKSIVDRRPLLSLFLENYGKPDRSAHPYTPIQRVTGFIRD
jgi:hypothetical protein